MPNIYYCNGLANSDLGRLRAVLSWEECRNLLKLCSVQYAGLQFPTMAQGRASDFAVLRILDEEQDDKWQVGFYSFDGDILRGLSAKTSDSANRRMRANLLPEPLPPGRKLVVCPVYNLTAEAPSLCPRAGRQAELPLNGVSSR